MNYRQTLKGKLLLVLPLVAVFYSCDQAKETHSETLGDSINITAPIERKAFTWNDSVHESNAVRVAMDSAGDFDWNTFRNKFHTQDSSESFGEDVAVGPWVNWEEYEYRQVYRYANNTLWIQTFYRDGDTTAIDSTDHTVLLDSQDPNYRQLGPLWTQMATRGAYLADSLK